MLTSVSGDYVLGSVLLRKGIEEAVVIHGVDGKLPVQGVSMKQQGNHFRNKTVL